MSSSILFSIWITIVVIPQLSISYTKTCGWYGCDGTTMNCPVGQDCEIKCSDYHACAGATINCAADHQCTIRCQDSASCYGLTVHGQHSSKLEFTGCQSTTFGGDYTCADMTVYCPPNVNGNKKCIMAGNKALGGQDSPYMQFYAIYGWKDIDFSGYSGSWTTRKGTMHCTSDYSKSCSIDSGFLSGYWTCDDRDHICMDPPTPSPTSTPTKAPTNLPSIAPTKAPTKIPTKFPTKIPTNFPSKAPTNFPSKAPTNFPTNSPTKTPTNFPTKTPTNFPTNTPTEAPTIKPSVSPTTSPTRAFLKNLSDDTKLSIPDTKLSDSLEVNDPTTTTKLYVQEAIDVTTTHHDRSRIQEYIIWIAIAFGLIIFNCGLCVYCRAKRKQKRKIYHTEHYGNNDNKDIEMQEAKTGDIIIDGDGMQTIIPPKKGKIKYSPLGAQNLKISLEPVASQSSAKEIDVPPPISIAKSHSMVTSTLSSINNIDAFILDARNDTEVLEENEMGITPCFDDSHAIFGNDEDIMTTKGYDIEDEQQVDIIVPNDGDQTPQDDEKMVIDEMVHDVNNDMVIDGDGTIKTNGNDADIADIDKVEENMNEMDVEIEDEDETIVGIENS